MELTSGGVQSCERPVPSRAPRGPRPGPGSESPSVPRPVSLGHRQPGLGEAAAHSRPRGGFRGTGPQELQLGHSES